MRNAHAAQHDRIARAEGMHVVAGRDPGRGGAARGAAPQHLVGDAEIFRRRQLPIVFRAFDQRYVEPVPFGDARIVGEGQRRILGRRAMRREDRVETEALRRLRAPKLGAIHRAGHATVRATLQRIGDRQAGQGARVARKPAITRPMRSASAKGRAASWISTEDGASRAAKRFETQAARSLAGARHLAPPRAERVAKGALVAA